VVDTYDAGRGTYLPERVTERDVRQGFQAGAVSVGTAPIRLSTLADPKAEAVLC
jgi:hypothetical protein